MYVTRILVIKTNIRRHHSDSLRVTLRTSMCACFFLIEGDVIRSKIVFEINFVQFDRSISHFQTFISLRPVLNY